MDITELLGQISISRVMLHGLQICILLHNVCVYFFGYDAEYKGFLPPSVFLHVEASLYFLPFIN